MTAPLYTPELADKYDSPAEKKNVLPPIPEGCATPARWKTEFAQRPLVVPAALNLDILSHQLPSSAIQERFHSVPLGLQTQT